MKDFGGSEVEEDVWGGVESAEVVADVESEVAEVESEFTEVEEDEVFVKLIACSKFCTSEEVICLVWSS